MEALLKADGRTESGGSALVVHNPRLADPLDEHTRGVAAISKKRNKTEADYYELGHREFIGGLYTNGNGPCVPAVNIIRCLQDGAKRHKRGVHILQGVHPLIEHADLRYEGDEIRDPEKMWKAGTFSLRKTIGVRGARTVRTRPIFTEWSLELPVEVDSTIFDLDTLQLCWADAGRFMGIGEMRPIYGRFLGTIKLR